MTILDELHSLACADASTRQALLQAVTAVRPDLSPTPAVPLGGPDTGPDPRELQRRADAHLQDWADRLAIAVVRPADPDGLAVAAWELLSELNEAVCRHVPVEASLQRIIAQARVQVARGGPGLARVTAFLAAAGQMPAPGVPGEVMLAWAGGQPRPRQPQPGRRRGAIRALQTSR